MAANPPDKERGGRAWVPLLVGMLTANAVTLGFFGVIFWEGKLMRGSESFVIGTMAVLPLAGGLAAGYCWRSLDLTVGRTLLHSLNTTLLGIVGGAVILREGVVCLVILLPLHYLLIFTGAALGRIWFKVDRSKMQLWIFPVLALLAGGEGYTRIDEQAVVVDEVLIHASPQRVWPHVLAFPEITEPPRYWIFRLGLPYPVKTTNGGNFVGADRQCIFSGGNVLKETIAELVPNERLTFDISEQPTDPEAYGHLTLHRGRFELRDNHDGTTTLIGSSWYTLHVRPLWYFDWWTRDMTREVHLRVMNHVKRLAESGR